MSTEPREDIPNLSFKLIHTPIRHGADRSYLFRGHPEYAVNLVYDAEEEEFNATLSGPDGKIHDLGRISRTSVYIERGPKQAMTVTKRWSRDEWQYRVPGSGRYFHEFRLWEAVEKLLYALEKLEGKSK